MLKSDRVLINGLWSAALRFVPDQFIQKFSAMSIIIYRINGSPNNYRDTDIPWKICTSKTASL